MSLEATNHVWKHTNYTAAQSYILLAIADVVNDTYKNCFFMGIKELARKTKCSERTVQRALRQFEKDGWLQETGEYRKDQFTEYVFRFRSGDKLTGVTDQVTSGDKSSSEVVTDEVFIPLLELNRTQEELKSKEVEQSSPDTFEICFYLAKAIENRGLRPRPREDWITGVNWLSEARLLLEGKIGKGDTKEDSGRLSTAQIRAAIDYAMNDSFWATNILSPAKLRKQYPMLRMQATAAKEKRQPKGQSAIEQIREEESRKVAQNALN